MSKIVPLRDYVLVKKVPQETVSEGGLILPDAKHYGTRNRVCVVEAVGPDVTEVVVGDIVQVELYDPEERNLYKEGEILCVMTSM